MLNAHRLRLLVELHRRGTLLEVARTLSYSPSTISAQLSQLEEEAGVALLEAAGRGVRLTAAGEMLVGHAREILARIEMAEADLAASRDEIVGVLRVAIFQTATIALMPDVLRRLEVLHPSLDVYLSELQPDEAGSALLAREFDLVLGEEFPGFPQPRSPDIEQRDVFEDPLRLYCPGRRGASIRELADFPWVMEPAGLPARTWAESVCRAAGFEPDVRYESADLLVHVSLADAGRAAALLPDLVWRRAVPELDLQPLPAEPVRRVYTAVRRGSSGRPALEEFRRVLAEVSRDARSGSVHGRRTGSGQARAGSGDGPGHA